MEHNGKAVLVGELKTKIECYHQNMLLSGDDPHPNTVETLMLHETLIADGHPIS